MLRLVQQVDSRWNQIYPSLILIYQKLLTLDLEVQVEDSLP